MYMLWTIGLMMERMNFRGLCGRYPDKVKIDRFPASGKKDYFDLYHQMAWTEELAKTLNYEWFIHYDADEIRVAPWKVLH